MEQNQPVNHTVHLCSRRLPVQRVSAEIHVAGKLLPGAPGSCMVTGCCVDPGQSSGSGCCDLRTCAPGQMLVPMVMTLGGLP